MKFSEIQKILRTDADNVNFCLVVQRTPNVFELVSSKQVVWSFLTQKHFGDKAGKLTVLQKLCVWVHLLWVRVKPDFRSYISFICFVGKAIYCSIATGAQSIVDENDVFLKE